MVVIKAVITAAPNTAATVVIRAIRRAPAQVVAILAIPAPSAAAPMSAMRASACNAVLPCHLVNVPAAARNCRRAPSFAASAANPSSNAAHTPL